MQRELEYKNQPDEQLIRELRDGCQEIMDYILEKYKGLVLNAPMPCT